MDTDTPTKPTLDERYAVAIGSSNLKYEVDHHRPLNVLDMIIASGMNPHRMGTALTRLASEWDASAKPRPMEPKRIEELARTYRKQEDGLVLIKTMKAGKEVDERVLPLVLAKREADCWHAHELRLLLQRLKTLPEVRAGLVWWAEKRLHIERPLHVVAQVLLWWLHPTCPVCQGVKQRVIAGTGRTSSKNCTGCRGTGSAKVPHGRDGRRVLAYINSCRVAAVKFNRAKYSHHEPKKAGAQSTR